MLASKNEELLNHAIIILLVTFLILAGILFLKANKKTKIEIVPAVSGTVEGVRY